MEVEVERVAVRAFRGLEVSLRGDEVKEKEEEVEDRVLDGKKEDMA